MTGEIDGPPPEERVHPDGRCNSRGIRIDPAVEAEPEASRAVLSILVEHEPGVLSEVSGLFSRRQFNIESLTVGPTSEPERARITVVCEEPDPGIDQLKKQVEKLLPVVSVSELPDDGIRRELALLKVDGDDPDQVQAVADMYDATTVDACPETVTVEVTGSRQKVDAAVETLGRFGIREYVRTGTTAMARSTEPTTDAAPAHAHGTGDADQQSGSGPAGRTDHSTDNNQNGQEPASSDD